MSRTVWSLAFLLPLLPLLPSAVSAQGFGQAVAVSEGDIFVGQPLNERSPGALYVYGRDGAEWTERARLEARDGYAGDHFARSLVATGDALLVGATSHFDGRGAVFVFRRDGSGGWESAGEVRPDDLSPQDYFGRAAAGSGDAALFATWGQAEARGAVYALRRDAAGEWTVEDKLVPEDAQPNDWFGSGIAVDGDVALIGAFRRSEGRGTAYVFRRDPATGEWTQEARLGTDSLPPNARFGETVALRGDRGYVGAPGEDGNIGAVYVVEREDGEWSIAGKLLPYDAPPGGRFGSDLLLRDDELWVGTPGADRFRGGIYRFGAAEEGGWAFLGKLGIPEGQTGDQFGTPLAGGSELVVAAVPGADYGAGRVALLAPGEEGGWRQVAQVFSETEGLEAVVGGEVACADGEATETGFPCRQTRLLSFLPVQALGGGRGVETNDVWGWTDPETDREYALVGLSDRTTFVDVTDPVNPAVLGWLPKTEGSPGSTWRDIKVYRDHAYIVSDNALEHGMQVFDLRRLREAAPGEGPVTFEADARYDGIASAHNVVVDTATGFAFAVGSSGGGETCGGGLHMIDIREPASPTFAGCFADTNTGYARTGYTHDAQCVVYRGPDEEHRGKHICLGSNETALSIADVTDKENPVALAMATYPRVGYAHQGWLTEDHRYFYMDDEGDELNPELGLEKTRTLIWDLSDLDDPVLVKEYMGTTFTSDHNLYVKGDRMYQSNYVSGLRVLDISDPENPQEIAYFDTVPWSEEPGFDGSWSNYPYFDSGTIVVTSGKEGVFMVREDVQELVP